MSEESYRLSITFNFEELEDFEYLRNCLKRCASSVTIHENGHGNRANTERRRAYLYQKLKDDKIYTTMELYLILKRSGYFGHPKTMKRDLAYMALKNLVKLEVNNGGAYGSTTLISKIT